MHRCHSNRCVTKPGNDVRVLTSRHKAALSGYASDGGLYVPEHVPAVDRETFRSWAGLGFKELAARVLRLFIAEDDIPHGDLIAMIDRAFGAFDSDEIVNDLQPLLSRVPLT